MPCEALGRDRLQRLPHLPEVQHRIGAELADHGAAIGIDIEQPLRLELAQRFTDRGAAGVEALAKLALRDAVPRLVGAVGDQRTQLTRQILPEQRVLAAPILALALTRRPPGRLARDPVARLRVLFPDRGKAPGLHYICF